MRVTSSQMYSNARQGLQNKMQQLKEVQDQSLTGNRVIRPSDDPGASFRQLIFSSDLASVQSVKRTSDIGLGRLQVAAEKIGMMHENFLEAQDIVLTMGNDYQGDPVTMRSISYKAANLYEELKQTANSIQDGVSLFGGGKSLIPFDDNTPTTTQTLKRSGGTGGFLPQAATSFTATGLNKAGAGYPGVPASVTLTYLGATNQYQVQIDGQTPTTVAYGATVTLGGWVQFQNLTGGPPANGDSFTFQVVPDYQGGSMDRQIKISDLQNLPGNVTGGELVEGTGVNSRGVNLLGVMSGIRAALLRGDTGEVRAWQSQVEEGRAQVSDLQALSGLRSAQLEAFQKTFEVEDASMQETMAKNTQADMFDVLSRMEQTTQAMQAMTLSQRTVLNTSLLDIMR